MSANERKGKAGSENRDPISGEKGAHPVGVGVGTAAGAGAGAAAAGLGAAALTGAAAGSVVGPVGTAVGAIVGGIAGGLAGKAVAESIDPTVEERYWKDNYRSRPYVTQDAAYEDYAPAYRYGWESRARHADRDFDDVDLQSGWAKARAQSRLDWEQARQATRDAWNRAGGSTQSPAGSPRRQP